MYPSTVRNYVPRVLRRQGLDHQAPDARRQTPDAQAQVQAQAQGRAALAAILEIRMLKKGKFKNARKDIATYARNISEVLRTIVPDGPS